MNIKTITTADGVNAVDFGSGANRYYWFRNVGATAVHVSGKADIVAGGDGVAELAAGDSVCIETLGGKVYILGAGKIEIHNTGDKFPPFRNAPVTGGGEADAYTKLESDARYPLKSDTVPRGLGFGYGICNSAAATVSKSASVLGTDSPQWKRVDHSIVAIRFAAAVPANATLAINNRGSCPIYYHGVKITDGIIGAGDTVTFIYINDIYHVIGIENGGNADTVGGVGIANLRQITQTVINTLPAVPNGEGDFLVNCDASDTSFPYPYGHLSIRYGSYTGEYIATFRTTGNDDKIYFNTYLTNHWSGWQEISATPIKSTQISGTANTTGNLQLWETTDKKIPISAMMNDRYGYIFSSSSGFYYIGICHPDNHTMQVDEAVNGTVYYIEKNTINVG